MQITDIHTHAFPDRIAERAMTALCEECTEVTAYRDGTTGSLLQSMDKAGILRSVICSIATRPEQWKPIMDWSLAIQSARLIPLASVHPLDPDAVKHIEAVAAAGLPGIKLHPYYQDFALDDERFRAFFDAVQSNGLIVTSHTGFDVAFPHDDRAAPYRIVNLLNRHQHLKLITTHLGAWSDWSSVEKLLLGRPVWIEISYSLEILEAAKAREMLLRHPPEHLLFGTDSPWQDQSAALKRLHALQLPATTMQAMLQDNALRLFPA